MPRLCCLIAFSRQLDVGNYNNAREIIHTSRFTALSLDGIRMPAPVFGFGVGDVVAVSTLIWKLCKALKDTSDDLRDFAISKLNYSPSTVLLFNYSNQSETL